MYEIIIGIRFAENQFVATEAGSIKAEMQVCQYIRIWFYQTNEAEFDF